ncbi:ROK family transcriptional regulator [Candidatus Kaiserbacteria bacterium]|nr:ROK family transcriptional regulator [Candidatus Kaiserbacteria bacterium]
MPRHILGNRDFSRALNRSTVLNTVKSRGPIARTEVARHTGLSAATVTGITSELIREGLIFEKASGDSRGGRRPILLALNPRGGFVVGLKLTESEAIGALTDLEATVIAKRVGRLASRSPEKVVEALAALVTNLVTENNLRKKQLLGVGLGLAGIVDAQRGILRQSPYFGWRDLPLRRMLQEHVRTAVHIDNDVNTLTITEKWFGAGQGTDDFLTVTVGRGVGLGIVVNGQFYRGASGGAGEFGHTVVDPDGPPCDCGKRGCLETFVGDPGLLRMASEAVSKGMIPGPVKDIDDLLALAKDGSAAAQAVFARAGDVLGQGIANLINIFNPQCILISGEGVRAGDWLFGPMREAVASHVMPGLAGNTEIRIDPWGDDAWARGAAGLVLRELFESPLHREPVESVTTG